MGFSRQEYWGDLPHPGIKPGSPALQAGSLLTATREAPRLRDSLAIEAQMLPWAKEKEVGIWGLNGEEDNL